MMKSESDRPITIEDLIRLKRAERPPAEFWTTFDRELRAKQLSALVGKRPWWQTFPKSFPRLFRYSIPLGASAALVIALVSLRHDRSTPAPAADRAVDQAPPVEVLASIAAPAPVAVARVSTPVELTAVVGGTSTPEVAVSPAAVVVAQATIERVPMPLGGVPEAEREENLSPSAREIAANLAVIRSNEPFLSNSLLAQNTGSEGRPALTRVAIEPLQQMTPPSDTRRSRLLTAMVAAVSTESSFRTTERAASRIAEDRLYDQIHRFDARGDRVQLKF